MACETHGAVLNGLLPWRKDPRHKDDELLQQHNGNPTAAMIDIRDKENQRDSERESERVGLCVKVTEQGFRAG